MSTKPSDIVTPTTLTGLVVAFVGITAKLLTEFGLNLTEGQQSIITDWTLIAVSLVLFVVAAIANKRAVDKAKVVEQTSDGSKVTAGPANELPTGTVVRNDLGEREPRRAEDTLDSLTGTGANLENDNPNHEI